PWPECVPGCVRRRPAARVRSGRSRPHTTSARASILAAMLSQPRSGGIPPVSPTAGWAVRRSTCVNVVLWVLQGVLAAAFLTAGLMKMTQPKDKLVPKLPWVEDFSTGTVRFIGVAEFLGAVGLIL